MCSKNVHVDTGMVKSVQHKMRTSLRKKYIYRSREESSHATQGHKGKHQVLVMWQMRGVKTKSRPEPFFGFPWEWQLGRINYFEHSHTL
jgi:hypothetical protein